MRGVATCVTLSAALLWLPVDAVDRQTSPAGVDRLLAPTTRSAAQPQAVLRFRVTLPQDDTELRVNDQLRSGFGTFREVRISVAAPGTGGEYKLTATWSPNSHTTITRSTMVWVGAGGVVNVDLAAENATDRVQIRYVATPSYVVSEMIALADIRDDDVVFEPGCGDARVTIAALKAGAKRGVGIDLDPERVAESKKNVNEADLDSKIAIRLGDALEIPDLSTATVVFLYMGDDFNRLIRPILQKQLPVGARIVSHRLTMGDWLPDKTISLPDEAGNTDLHLWTIKSSHKTPKHTPPRRRR